MCPLKSAQKWRDRAFCTCLLVAAQKSSTNVYQNTRGLARGVQQSPTVGLGLRSAEGFWCDLENMESRGCDSAGRWLSPRAFILSWVSGFFICRVLFLMFKYSLSLSIHSASGHGRFWQGASHVGAGSVMEPMVFAF